MVGRCLELGRIGSHIPFCCVGLDYPYILKAASVCKGFEVLLQFTHPLGMTRSIFQVILLFRQRLVDLEFECSSLLVFVEDELSPSFLLPLDLLEGVLPFGFFVPKQL